MRAYAEWHFGLGPDYCRGCAALDRDCGLACPYAAYAPASGEGVDPGIARCTGRITVRFENTTLLARAQAVTSA